MDQLWSQNIVLNNENRTILKWKYHQCLNGFEYSDSEYVKIYLERVPNYFPPLTDVIIENNHKFDLI